MLKANIVQVSKTHCIARGNCAFTGKPYQTKEFPKECVSAYNAGKMVQDAFHMLSAGDREFLISRISPEGWIEMFSGEDEEQVW